MRTTLDIDDSLLEQAKRSAAREHTSLTRLIEKVLAARLRNADRPRGEPSRVRLPVFAGRGGLQKVASRKKGALRHPFFFTIQRTSMTSSAQRYTGMFIMS